MYFFLPACARSRVLRSEAEKLVSEDVWYQGQKSYRDSKRSNAETRSAQEAEVSGSRGDGSRKKPRAFAPQCLIEAPKQNSKNK